MAASSSIERLTLRDGRYLVKFRGHWQERIFLHPGSVNFSFGEFRCPYLVYYEKSGSGSVGDERPGAGRAVLRDSTMVSPYAMLLFGGILRVNAASETIAVGTAEWVRFRAEPRIGALLKMLRQALAGLLADKIERPHLDLTQSPILDAIARLLLAG